MKLIIAGSRAITHVEISPEIIRLNLVPCEIVSGCAPGPDVLGEAWAESRGIPVRRFPADWARFGKFRAGTIRNNQMASYADALLAFWDGGSPGTAHMILTMRSLGKPAFVVNVP